jgi:hypothetical protein
MFSDKAVTLYESAGDFKDLRSAPARRTSIFLISVKVISPRSR